MFIFLILITTLTMWTAMDSSYYDLGYHRKTVVRYLMIRKVIRRWHQSVKPWFITVKSGEAMSSDISISCLGLSTKKRRGCTYLENDVQKKDELNWRRLKDSSHWSNCSYLNHQDLCSDSSNWMTSLAGLGLKTEEEHQNINFCCSVDFLMSVHHLDK